MKVDPSELVGKTIKEAFLEKAVDSETGKEYDDMPYLHIITNDDSYYLIIAWYGMYSGNSQDEYPVFITLFKLTENQ